ncbi:biotin/lipoyl-binding protein, partial [Paraburkholderia aspalathi]|nr:biotin/lipoyl-binding protein [Paraburkholderia aspalathi]
MVGSQARVLLTIALLWSVDSAAAADNMHMVPVAVETVTFSDYQPKLTLSGAIAARRLVDLSFRISGQIVERTVDVGSRVNPGDILARIDDSEQQSNLRAAQASRDAANAQLIEMAGRFDRQKKLLVQGFTTRSQYDQAEQQWRTAQGTLTSADSQLANARDELAHTELRAS